MDPVVEQLRPKALWPVPLRSPGFIQVYHLSELSTTEDPNEEQQSSDVTALRVMEVGMGGFSLGS